jgi:hypothetical protein
VTVWAADDSKLPVWSRICPEAALSELPREKGWTVLMVTFPPRVVIAAVDEIARPALSTSGLLPTVELKVLLMARSRTALSVRVALAPAVLLMDAVVTKSPFPAAALAVLRITELPALRAVWMVALFATAGDVVGVKTLGFPPLKVPALLAAVVMETSLAAWTTPGESVASERIASSWVMWLE